MRGSGTPSALQLSVIGSFFGTVIEAGCSVMWGALTSPAHPRKALKTANDDKYRVEAGCSMMKGARTLFVHAQQV